MPDTQLRDAVFYVPRETLLLWISNAAKYHDLRHDCWNHDLEKLEESIPDNLKIDAFNHSGGRGVAANIDPKLQRELQTAMSRAAHHKAQIDFLANVRVLIEADEGKSTIPLTVNDVGAFFTWRQGDDSDPD